MAKRAGFGGGIMLIRILFLLAVAAGAAAPSTAQAPGQTQAAEERVVFLTALRQSQGAGVIEALERNFPEETRAMLDRVAQIVVENLEQRDRAVSLALREMQAFTVARVGEAVNAPAAELVRVARARLALYERVQREDVALCGRLASGAADPRTLPEAFREAGAAIFPMMIDAAAAGRRRGPVAGRGSLTPADSGAWARAMLAQGQNGPPAAGAESQCRQLVVMYRTMVALPPETAGNAMAYIVAQETAIWSRRAAAG